MEIICLESSHLALRRKNLAAVGSQFRLSQFLVMVVPALGRLPCFN
jgi:hypothetical protein